MTIEVLESRSLRLLNPLIFFEMRTFQLHSNFISLRSATTKIMVEFKVGKSQKIRIIVVHGRLELSRLKKLRIMGH